MMGGWINGRMDRCHNKTVWKAEKKGATNSCLGQEESKESQ